MLVLLGVRLDGTKELTAPAEGLRESTESWADLLRDCRRRGMRDPELVVGDGATGLWKALATGIEAPSTAIAGAAPENTSPEAGGAGADGPSVPTVVARTPAGGRAGGGGTGSTPS